MVNDCETKMLEAAAKLRRARTEIGGSFVDVEVIGGDTLEAVPAFRQRLDHYGNDGEGWDDAWYDDYAIPLRRQVEAVLGDGFQAEVGDKGRVYVYAIDAKPAT